MIFEVSWGSISKIAVAGMASYVFFPVLMTLRDAILWLIIDRAIFTSKKKSMVASFCLDRAWIDHAGLTPFRVRGSGELTKYYLADREVEPEVFFSQHEAWKRKSISTAKQSVRIQRLEKTVDRLLKYFKQEEDNPVRLQRERLYESHSASFREEREQHASE